MRSAHRVAAEPINLREKLSGLLEHWSPRVVAELNDYQFKVAKFEGDFVWHEHAETDEAFLVLAGSMGIGFRDRAVRLNAGELLVVPRAVEHRPFAESECQVLLIEPRGVVNTGRSGGELTADNDRWL